MRQHTRVWLWALCAVFAAPGVGEAAQWPGNALYEVQVKTASNADMGIDSAGTDAHVSISLIGPSVPKGTVFRALTHSGNPFESGALETFTIEASDMAEVTQVRIKHDNTGTKPGWALEYVKVRKKPSGVWVTFPCYRWLASDEDDGAIERVLTAGSIVTYNVQVVTGLASNAGTDGNVFLYLSGSAGKTFYRKLDKPNYNDFERGATDLYSLECPSLGSEGAVLNANFKLDPVGPDPGWCISAVIVGAVVNGQSRSWRWGSNLAGPLPQQWLDNSSPSKRMRMIQLNPQSVGLAHWTATVRTARNDDIGSNSAGTDACVQILFYRTGAHLVTAADVGEWRTLDLANRDEFESGSSDTFSFMAEDFPTVGKLIVEHDNTGTRPGWALESITLRKGQEASIQFPAYCWLATDEPQAGLSAWLYPGSPVTYQVTITTANVDRAGTDANVYCRLQGAKGTTYNRKLDKPNYDDFERNSTATYSIVCRDLGSLSTCYLGHDDSGNNADWAISQVSVSATVGGQSRTWTWRSSDPGQQIRWMKTGSLWTTLTLK